MANTFKKLRNPENKHADGATALIIDDTIGERTKFKIGNITYVFDHVKNKTVYGRKLLAMTCFNGKSSIPLDFTIYRERKLECKKAKQQYENKVDHKSNGGKR